MHFQHQKLQVVDDFMRKILCGLLPDLNQKMNLYSFFFSQINMISHHVANL